ncbi:MAG: class I SAM-dependent methyltransferase [bacterium]|nr:class I SAM-dependent methyltransferase [bacterium]
MSSNPQPFDPLAATYDQDFTHSPIGRLLRGQVHQRLLTHFCPGHHVLELGCGTGEDALFLAGHGVHVTATDASERMLETAKTKAGGTALVTFQHLDLSALPSEPPSHCDGAFSNFGPLNCMDDWRPLAVWLAERIKPGGIAAFAVMSPFCLWEMLWHSAHGDLRTAFRRWRDDTVFQADDEAPLLTIRYPTIRRLTQDFSPVFRRIHVQPLGLFLPPSDVFGVIETRPRLLKRLVALEKRFTQVSSLALAADHYWIEFERLS